DGEDRPRVDPEGHLDGGHVVVVPVADDAIEVEDHRGGLHRPAPRARSWSMTSGSVRTSRSPSGSLVDHPTETRSDRCASTPMASSTGEGSSDSELHELPECTATPARSRPSSTGWGSTPSMPRHTRWGNRWSRLPSSATP